MAYQLWDISDGTLRGPLREYRSKRTAARVALEKGWFIHDTERAVAPIEGEDWQAFAQRKLPSSVI
jgi:hypothetical protein